jgi:hypothetical protein
MGVSTQATRHAFDTNLNSNLVALLHGGLVVRVANSQSIRNHFIHDSQSSS